MAIYDIVNVCIFCYTALLFPGQRVPSNFVTHCGFVTAIFVWLTDRWLRARVWMEGGGCYGWVWELEMRGGWGGGVVVGMGKYE